MKIISKRVDYGSLYKTYEKEFYNAKRAAEKKGLFFNWDTKMSFQDFKSFFETHKTSMIEKGQNPSSIEIVKAMVDDQRYTASEKQAKAILKALRAKGLKSDLATVRTYAGYYMGLDVDEDIPFTMKKEILPVKEFFDIVHARYAELKLDGLRSAAAKLIIAQEFFGS